MQTVLRNLLLADWYDEDHKESIMSLKRRKWCRELLKNVRMACSVAGAVDIQVRARYPPCLCTD